MTRKRILFAGYAPVHFVCFQSVYRYLVADPRVEVWLSGGFKRTEGQRVSYSLEGFYDSFEVQRDHVIPIEQARQESFDVLVCAHLSDSLFPRSVNRTVQIFHGVSFKNMAVREKALRFDLLCLPGRYHAEMYRRQKLVKPGKSRCLVTGFPKVDSLVTGAIDRVDILSKIGVDPNRPTLLYAPTGDKNNSLEVMGEEVVRAIRDAGEWNLLIKLHDHAKSTKTDWLTALTAFEDSHIRLVRDWNILPFLRVADLLITDASSVAVEYTLLDRPIVFLDVPKLLEKVVKKRHAPLDLDTYGRKIGTVVKTPEQVVDVIKASLAEPGRESKIRQAMARHVFHDPGRASRRVTGVIEYAAGFAQDLPEGVEQLKPEETFVSETMSDSK